jgi:enoyl-CoA hydratase/carnithine racemase
MSEEKVVFERRGRIGLFTLNRPAQRNAVDPDVTRLMNDLMTSFEADDDLWVGVITGSGEAAFSAGADLKAIADGRLTELVDVDPGGFAGVVRMPGRKPLIAAVNGAALAGGCEIALACDLIVAAEHARFGLPEVRRGIIAGAGGLQRLVHRIPPCRALELVMTGRLISAPEALELGLVNEVVPGDRVLARALELAEDVAANAPVAVQESRAVMHTSLRLTEDEAWRRADEAWQRVLSSHDAAEGPRAFAEKREPVWEGR